jgi:hypothetical protein
MISPTSLRKFIKPIPDVIIKKVMKRRKWEAAVGRSSRMWSSSRLKDTSTLLNLTLGGRLAYQRMVNG